MLCVDRAFIYIAIILINSTFHVLEMDTLKVLMA